MKKNVVIIILLLAVIGSVGYIGYDKIYLEKNAPKEEKEPEQEEIPEEETINANSTFVEDLRGRYDYYFISDVNLENMLYKGDNTNASSLRRFYKTNCNICILCHSKRFKYYMATNI